MSGVPLDSGARFCSDSPDPLMRATPVAVLIAAAGLWLTPPADAALFVVNDCTLRAAIDQANADSVSDTINFAP